MGLALAGCVSYPVTMNVIAPASDSPQASIATETQLIGAVGRAVGDFGFRSMRLPPPETLASLEEADPDHLLASFTVDDDRRTHGKVTVSVLRRNADNQLSVLILDFDSFGATDYTTRLEQSLATAVPSAVPGARIESRRRHVFPALGP